nr:ribosomal protein S19, mitochondrial-like [Tanacetum cinerariifolium]
MGYKSQVRRSAQSERKRSGKVIVRNVVQATGSACHMKKATTMGDEGDVGLPYRCSACKAIQTTLARWVLCNLRIVASATFDPFVNNLSFVRLLAGPVAFKEAPPRKRVESSFDRYDNEEVALRSSIQGSRSRREVALAMLNQLFPFLTGGEPSSLLSGRATRQLAMIWRAAGNANPERSWMKDTKFLKYLLHFLGKKSSWYWIRSSLSMNIHSIRLLYSAPTRTILKTTKPRELEDSIDPRPVCRLGPFRSLGIPQNREALSAEGAALYTGLGT